MKTPHPVDDPALRVEGSGTEDDPWRVPVSGSGWVEPEWVFPAGWYLFVAEDSLWHIKTHTSGNNAEAG